MEKSTGRGVICCRLDGKDVAPTWRGNRMVFEGLHGSEQLTLETPCKPEKVTYTLVNIGDPLNRGVFLGPVGTKSGYADYQRYMEIGRDEGAVIACGGWPEKSSASS